MLNSKTVIVVCAAAVVAASCATTPHSGNSWAEAKGKFPPDSVLATVPERMLQLRPGMTWAELTTTLRLKGYDRPVPIGGAEELLAGPRWQPAWFTTRYEVQFRQDLLAPRPLGIRIRRVGGNTWIECDLQEK